MGEDKKQREYFRVNPAVQVILMRDGKILMLLRTNTHFEDNAFGFPAGNVEDHEQPSTAAIREAKEEVEVDIDPADLKEVYTIHRINYQSLEGRQVWVDFVFLAEKWKGEPFNAEPHKHGRIEWFDPKQLPPNIVHFLPQVIHCWQKGIPYSEIINK